MQGCKGRDQRVTTVTMVRVKDSPVLAGGVSDPQISNRSLSPLRLPLDVFDRENSILLGYTYIYLSTQY